MYWLGYSQMKGEARDVSLSAMVEVFKGLQDDAREMFRDIPYDNFDNPFYEYAVSDMEHSLLCYELCMLDKEEEQVINYYCKRIGK